MARDYQNTFFDEKRLWSKYKDLVLGYYLKPYLAKVAKLGRPVTIFDMFAGPGRFRDGCVGSPLIIANRLVEVAAKGIDVRLVCIEQRREYFDQLTRELSHFPFATPRLGDSLDFTDDIVKETDVATVFLYVDPCNIANLDLSRLANVYTQIAKNRSVEVLQVFMARAFLRSAYMLLAAENRLADGPLNDPLIRDAQPEDIGLWIEALYGDQDTRDWAVTQSARKLLDRVAGGDYWERIALDTHSSHGDKLQQLVDQYVQRLGEWFDLTCSYPIMADSGDPHPKYWLIFGSRYPPAVDLFNRAACKARREQGVSYRTEGSLFEGVDIDTSADPGAVRRAISEVLDQAPDWKWGELRWAVTKRQLGRFTDAEIDRSIKALIQDGRVMGPPSARKDDDAKLKLRLKA